MQISYSLAAPSQTTPSRSQTSGSLKNSRVTLPTQPLQTDNHRYEEMIRATESKGLKIGQNFDTFMSSLQNFRKASKKHVEDYKRGTRPVEVVQSPSPKPILPKKRREDKLYEHLIVKNPHDTDPQFKFTRYARKTAEQKQKNHMRQVVSSIRYDNRNSENVVKYLTKNQILYSNITQRKITAIVRKFPTRLFDMAANDRDLVRLPTKKSLSVVLLKNRDDKMTYLEDNIYDFERVYEDTAPNNIVYNESVSPLVNLLLSNPNNSGLFVSYGPRKSGKTYSLFGTVDKDQGSAQGLCHMAVKHFLEHTHKRSAIQISLYEVYLGKIYDLLNDGNDDIQTKEEKNNVVLQGLSEHPVKSIDTFSKLLQEGFALRNDSLEYPNEEGSRSYIVLLLKLGSTLQLKKDPVPLGPCSGQIAFVDMAAWEHGAETRDADKSIRMLASDIKRTNHAFLHCTRNIEQNKKYPPYRQRKLTTALRGFFTPQCQMLFMSHFISLESQEEQLFQTLDYTKKIQKAPGEVLELQTSKYSHYQAPKKTASFLDSPTLRPEYTSNITDYLVDNSIEDKIEKSAALKGTFSKTEERNRRLINVITHNRLNTSKSGTVSSPFITAQHFGEERVNSPLITLTKIESGNDSAGLKKKKGSKMDMAKLRMRKRKQLDKLLTIDSPLTATLSLLSPNSPRGGRPLSKYAVRKTLNSPFKIKTEKTENENTDRDGIKGDEDGYNEGNSENEEFVYDEEDPIRHITMNPIDSDLEDRVEQEERRRVKDLQRKELTNTFKGLHMRNSDEDYFLLERYGFKLGHHVTPGKAGREAIEMKNNFYRSAVDQFNNKGERVTYTSGDSEYTQTKREVFSHYESFSGVCETERKKNRGMSKTFHREIGNIKSDYKRLVQKFTSPDQEIEQNLMEDARHDHQAQKSFTRLKSSKRL